MDPRLAGVLLGTALGDALGLPCEGLSASVIARRFGRVERFHLLGATGFVSDDTEQTALVAHALCRESGDAAACARVFRRSLLAWFLRLPFGIGLATVRACMRGLVGLSRTGVWSAGNGCAMRAAVVGVFFREDSERRRRFGTALAEVTHTDPRAVEGALYVAEVAAGCASGLGPWESLNAARKVVTQADLGAAIDEALRLGQAGADTAEAVKVLGASGFIVHTAALASFVFLRYGQAGFPALVETVSAGGDTDTIGAIVGGWVGALHGDAGLPNGLLAQIQDGPFGKGHLRALARALTALRQGSVPESVGFSGMVALLRNLALYPVILAHGVRRLLPF